MMRALGLGLLNPRLVKDVLYRRNHGKPVLDLDHLLKVTMQQRKPLDWDKFCLMQNFQPLKVVASGLKRQGPVILDMENGAFQSLGKQSNAFVV